ncbi:MAG: 2-C-methyl-D-erythritol 4-phosphate cytidylyltransferase [Bacteroidales bacterium]|jgi:2-C-methyl-D-erythritol 4-phosphate cytidylyltransferase
MKKIALIVAGGTGSRMESDTPKQFMLLNNLPVLMHCINSFCKYDNNLELRLVLPESEMETWKQLGKQYHFKTDITVFPGGETRFQSVKNGIQEINGSSLVAIHDGVRPLVTPETISNCFALAEKQGTAVPVIPIPESIRKVQEQDSFAEPRSQFRIVQTPQVFQSEFLLDAYETEYDEDLTDDASVVEKAGYKIYLAEGNRENIKITDPIDLIIAETLLKHMKK